MSILMDIEGVQEGSWDEVGIEWLYTLSWERECKSSLRGGVVFMRSRILYP
jgi:hypothetical protein